MITAIMCEFLINGGWRGVKLLKAQYRQAIGNRNVTFAFSKMQLLFYSITIDENTEYINGIGYL